MNGAGSCYILMSGPLSKWKEMRGLLPALFCPQKAHSQSTTAHKPSFRVMYCAAGTGLEVHAHTVEHLAARWITVKEQKNDDKGE